MTEQGVHLAHTSQGFVGDSQRENDYEMDQNQNPTKPAMSQGENDHEKELEHLTSTISETEISQAENDHEKELEHLTSTIAEKIDEGDKKTESFFSSACIYRVSDELRQLKESAYTPKLIAIGPLHQKDDHLQTPLQHVKMSYTKYLLSRVTAGMDPELAKPENFKLLKECLAEMKTLIDKAKKCYAAEVTLDEEMMLVDGCFILEYLYRRAWGGPESEPKTADPIYGNQLTATIVGFDLLFFENQIPFLVLQKLFQLTIARIPNRPREDLLLSDYVKWKYRYRICPSEGSSNNSGSAKTWCSPRDCVLRIFGNKQEIPTTKEEQHEDRNAKYCFHILHEVHDAFKLPSDQTKMEGPLERIEVMPSASELVYAGVKFVPCAAENLLKVKFTEPKGLLRWCHSAHFEIPRLEIDDDTESLFRNLVALEQCCPDVSQTVSPYVHLMDMLVNSDKDVQMLEKAGVIVNRLGSSQDATDLFNNLTKGILVRHKFAKTYKKATQYSERFWPRNLAHLRRTYFSSPWTFIAFCAGFFVFVVTIVQFVSDFLRKKG